MITVMALTLSSPAFLDHDVACATCGYNLRTLRVDGRCPECGAGVEPSVWIFRRKQERRPQTPELLSAADPRWVRQIHFGAAISLLVFLLMLTMSFAPSWAYQWRSAPRRVMLGIACATWVLSCYSAWKLAVPEPLRTRDGRPTNLALYPKLVRHRAGRRLRVCVIVYAFGVVLLSLPYHRDEPAWPWQLMGALGLLCLFAGLLAAWLYYHHFSRLAWRLGSRNISIQAKVLGGLNVLVFVAPILLPELDGSDDSLSGMMRMPTIAFGSAHAMDELISSLQYGNLNWFDMMYLALIFWELFVAVWLFYRVIAIKRARPRSLRDLMPQ
jgi:hypothetical protein